MKLTAIDHIVLTVKDLPKTIDFYTRILGGERVVFGEDRQAIQIGNQKINLHQLGSEYIPHAKSPTPEAMDLCLLTDTCLDQLITCLAEAGVSIIEGPVERTGAIGPLTSLYIRDPDENLIEIAQLNSVSTDPHVNRLD